MGMKWDEFLKTLETADPGLAAEVSGRSPSQPPAPLLPWLGECVEDIVGALAQEMSFGRAVALGYLNLAETTGEKELLAYQAQVRRFGHVGPELGKLMAEHLVPVLDFREEAFFQRFLEVMEVMLAKGVYTLYGPLKTLDRICEEKDLASAFAYLDLLEKTFSLDLTYKQARPFTYTLPKAVSSFARPKREFQIQQLGRVIQRDFELSDYFLNGLSKGLRLLTAQTLDEFVEKGLEKYPGNKKRCAKFLALESKTGLDLFEELQVAVPLSKVRQPLNRYIKARTGLSVSLKALSELPKRFLKGHGVKPLSCSDGKAIYLPDEMDLFSHRHRNLEMYQCLAKLEIGYFEFGSFDFDMEKLRARTDVPAGIKAGPLVSDFEAFILQFDAPEVASDLFTLFEHARLMGLSRIYYPGLVRKILPLLAEEWNTRNPEAMCGNPLNLLYQTLVLDLPWQTRPPSRDIEVAVNTILEACGKKFHQGSVVEDSAELVCRFYKDMKALLETGSKSALAPFAAPFHRNIQADLFLSGLQSMDEKARLLKQRLENLGLQAYQSDLRKKLAEQNGSLSSSDIQSLVLKRNDSDPGGPGKDANDAAGIRVEVSGQDLSQILAESGLASSPTPETTGPAFYYKEWDERLGDYLYNHALVHEKTVSLKDNDFYENTLIRYQGLVSRIKYAFEMLKPEELTLLRPWVEGDEFDYRALLDFATDKKAGIMPSDKLYMKRIKQQRDVAVLLLVDLSRSTANFVVDSPETVLDVEKQAIVLFCEALEIVGDQYAIAGFSGTGRLGVDYFKIKDFDETLNPAVRRRINAMAPQRSTRMGAAIRHATARLEKNPALVRLIILMGDGFPNDVDYKKEHAISDTRKAILEARSKNVYTHALTVNIAGDSKLDDLYGTVHHHIISDVRELPDRLPRIYSTLTKH
jgi:hypothetical protein